MFVDIMRQFSATTVRHGMMVIAAGRGIAGDSIRPDGLNLSQADICAATGDLADAYCPQTVKSYFIPGVTLLNMYLVSDKVPIWGTVLLGLCATFFIWVLSYGFDKSWQRWLARGILGVLLWSLMAYLSLYPRFWMNYEVTIDNNVSYVEFSNTYGTNIPRNGEIYTITGETHEDWIWNMKEYENEELGKLSER